MSAEHHLQISSDDMNGFIEIMEHYNFFVAFKNGELIIYHRLKVLQR